MYKLGLSLLPIFQEVAIVITATVSLTQVLIITVMKQHSGYQLKFGTQEAIKSFTLISRHINGGTDSHALTRLQRP